MEAHLTAVMASNPAAGEDKGSGGVDQNLILHGVGAAVAERLPELVHSLVGMEQRPVRARRASPSTQAEAEGGGGGGTRGPRAASESISRWPDR